MVKYRAIFEVYNNKGDCVPTVPANNVQLCLHGKYDLVIISMQRRLRIYLSLGTLFLSNYVLSFNKYHPIWGFLLYNVILLATCAIIVHIV